MILKSLSRKSNSSQLLGYILRYVLEPEKGTNQATVEGNEKPLIIRHNIRARSLQGYIREFEKNESYRLYKRKDSVKIFHNILSISSLDKEHVNDKMLKDLAKQFITLRGKNNLYLGAAHFDKDHVHLHISVSGTQLNGRSSRISKQQLHHIKLSLDAYQREKYPELIHSLPEHGKGKGRTREDMVKTAKVERQTNKHSLLTSLEEAFDQASSIEDFLSQVEAQGHQAYYRNGKLQGIKYRGDKKFRFNRLGFDEQRFEKLSSKVNEEQQTLSELRTIRKGHKQPSKELAVDVQEKSTVPEISAEEANMLEELESIRSGPKRRERVKGRGIDSMELEHCAEGESILQSKDEAVTSLDFDPSLTI